MKVNGNIKNMLQVNRKIKHLPIINSKAKFILFALIIIILSVVYFFFNRNDKLSESYYKKIIAIVNDDEVYLEEFNYFLNDLKYEINVKHNNNYEQFIIQEIKNHNIRQGLFADKKGRYINKVEMSNELKEFIFNQILEYKAQLLKANENNIKLETSDIRLIDAIIRSKKRAGFGTEQQKEMFFQNEYGMGTEESFRTILENTAIIKKYRKSIGSNIKDEEYRKLLKDWVKDMEVKKSKKFW